MILYVQSKKTWRWTESQNWYSGCRIYYPALFKGW
jgi:hypothetical protein